MAKAEAYLRAKFHLDPSTLLATIHQRYRQNRTDRLTDRQTTSDSIGRTVLQTVVQKCYNVKRHINKKNAETFWATVCKTVRPMLSDRCPVCPICPVCLSVCLSACDVGALWLNGWMNQDETCHARRLRPWPHCVRWGPSSPSPKGASPNFRPMSVVAKWLHGSRCHLARR